MIQFFKIRKAYSIKRALRNFNPHQPLWQSRELQLFYVSRGGSFLKEVVRLLKKSTSYYTKILLSGPPGCGKATELAKINEMLTTRFHVIPISAKMMTNDFSLGPEVILFHIIRLIGDLVKEKNKKIFVETVDPLVKRFQGWQIRKASVETNKQKAPPVMLEKIFNLEEAFSGDLISESKLFEKPNSNEYILGINLAAKALEKRGSLFFPGKQVLLLLYDFDKIELESAREVFITTFLPLVKIDCHAVCTFPLGLKYDRDFINMYRNFDQIYFLENFALKNKNGAINWPAFEKLVDVVQKRISLSRIAPETIGRIVNLSGGILFELINIVRQCCFIALREKVRFIDNEILSEAEARIRAKYKLALSADDLKNLAKINLSKQISEKLNISKFLNQYLITEYGSGDEVWYDVNPIIKPLLK